MTDLKTELSQFTGTEHWYKHMFGGMLYTDGVKYFAEHAGTYWFLDIVATELMKLAEREGFLSIHINSDGHAAGLSATEGNEKTLWSRHIDFTDCPAGLWKFFLVDNVLLLPSEY